jgi:pullulanase/glycogen debranching enzyme
MGFAVSLLISLSTETRRERIPEFAYPMLLHKAEKLKIEFAGIEAANEIRIRFNGKPRQLGAKDCIITPTTTVLALQMADTVTARLTTGSLDYRQNYSIAISGIGEKPLLPMGILDDFYSEKPLGHGLENGKSIFRLFAPRATKVRLFVFDRHDQEKGADYDMKRDHDGVWEFFAKENFAGKFYGYSVGGPAGADEMFDAAKIIADPYSRAVITRNEVAHPGRTLILPTDNFDLDKLGRADWGGDTFMKIPMEDLIIYEMHVRDLTAHPSSGVSSERRGSYRGLIESGKTGGIDYIKSLGVNAIELLPVQDFGNLELLSPAADGKQAESGWQQNHWGYMTSHFFAPESYYATGGTLKAGDWPGVDGRQVREFKEVVRAFHQNGIAVLMDVVYNHVSQYDQNCFKYIDKKYYFRLDGDGKFIATSGCGNDFKTERPMARRMILDSVEYWMREYHVDGFRFDLAAMIDWETCDAILKKAREINPHAIIIAEPWGGGDYSPAQHSEHGWAAWNDQIRNGVKGRLPTGKGDQGFIFGKWKGSTTMKELRSYVTGTLREDGGLFQKKSHAVNYLESHDDHTLGDFIRIASGEVDEHATIKDIDANAKLSSTQWRMNKLAALFLFTSQGATMIHEGQEFARSKVIFKAPGIKDEEIGKIDHNSYNKDNETNYLNFNHAEMNRELVDYYRGLIALRKAHRAFRWSDKKDIEFLKSKNEFALGYRIHRQSSGDSHDFIVLMNGHQIEPAHFVVPNGEWEVVVTPERAGLESVGKFPGGEFIVNPGTGVVMQGR